MGAYLKYKSSQFFQELYTSIPEIRPEKGISEYPYRDHLCEDNDHTILDVVTDSVRSEDIHKILLIMLDLEILEQMV